LTTRNYHKSSCLLRVCSNTVLFPCTLARQMLILLVKTSSIRFEIPPVGLEAHIDFSTESHFLFELPRVTSNHTIHDTKASPCSAWGVTCIFFLYSYQVLPCSTTQRKTGDRPPNTVSLVNGVASTTVDSSSPLSHRSLGRPPRPRLHATHLNIQRPHA
jgi:hypothetical protein